MTSKQAEFIGDAILMTAACELCFEYFGNDNKKFFSCVQKLVSNDNLGGSSSNALHKAVEKQFGKDLNKSDALEIWIGMLYFIYGIAFAHLSAKEFLKTSRGHKEIEGFWDIKNKCPKSVDNWSI